jgi:S1-C subfamily serine protease
MRCSSDGTRLALVEGMTLTTFFSLFSCSTPVFASEDGVPVLHFTISREVFQRTDQALEEGVPLGRALLHRNAEGEFDGYRILAIRSGSLPDQLGLKNGDLVMSVAGTKMTSMQAAVQAYQTVQAMDNFCVSLVRRGDPLELCYSLEEV